MIDHISSEYDMTPEQAYCLSGAAVDMKISEIVDGPNWIVSAYLPLSIFQRPKSSSRAAAVRAKGNGSRAGKKKRKVG
jgi:acetamidase/formamidase